MNARENTQKVIFKNDTVYGFIKTFLEKKALNSKNTSSSYETDIRQFFKATRYKNIEDLTIEDLTFTNSEVEEYQVSMSNEYSHSTIARKISAVKNLYSKLEANDYPVKEAWFNVDKIKGNSKSWEVIDWDTAKDMMMLADREIRKGDVKSALIETAVVTSFRQSSLLSMTWDNLTMMDGVWVLCAVDNAVGKGKKESIKPISNELYEKLMLIKKRYNHKHIFPLQKRTVVLMMQRYREKLGLPETVTFHSLKKCGMNEAYEISNGDIRVVAEQGDHADFGTSMKFYLNKKKKYSEMVGLEIGKEIDLSPLEELSHEELLELVRKSGRAVQRQLLSNI